MFREYSKTKDMSNKEVMYLVASEWIDDICFKAVNDADMIMADPIVNSIVRQAAEHILRYEEKRKQMALGTQYVDTFWYDTELQEVKAYKTVLYDNIFRNYGSNDHDK